MTKLNKGTVFPDLQVTEAFQGPTTTYALLNDTPTMFIILRYIGCTVCRYDVHMLIERYQEFKDKGVQVCVVMQSSQENVQKDLNNTPLPFPLICDTDLNVYHTLDIAPASSMEALVGNDLEALKEKGAKAQECGFTHGVYEGNEQQLPAFFYVNSNHEVEVAHYATTIMDMPNIDTMLEMIK